VYHFLGTICMLIAAGLCHYLYVQLDDWMAAKVHNEGYLPWITSHPPRPAATFLERWAVLTYGRDYSVRIRLEWLNGHTARYEESLPPWMRTSHASDSQPDVPAR
jgi:hypothetical protein